MEKNSTFKRAKGAYLKSINQVKYYDFISNSNILGHSFKKLTVNAKNNISSAWNITGNTIHHKNFKKLIENLCGNDYLLASSFSLMEFFSRFSAYAENMQIKLNAAGSNFKKWFDKNIIINEVKKFNKEADILDMAGFYIESGGNTSKIKEKIKTSGEYRILNYFWYPELTFDAFNSDIIILPEIYSGNFKYINILIKKKSRLFNDREIMLNSAESIPSLYISASLKNYFLIKNNENHQTVKLGWKNFTQVNRIFVYNKTDEGYMEIINFYKKNRILLNENAPYYNFLPIILDDNQKNYLSRIKS